MEKISLKDSPIQEDKPKNDEHGEVQEVKVEPTQLLPKDWRCASNHPKDLIMGDISKRVTTRSKLHDLCGHFTFISHIEPKNILEAEADSYWLLIMQEEPINLNAIKFDTLFLDPMIDQLLVLNEFLGTNWMSRVMLIVHIFCILFITLLHLSCNKSANFFYLKCLFCRR